LSEELRLADLVPAETRDRLLSCFEAITGVPLALTDLDGVPLTELESPMAYCGSLVRPQGAQTLCLRRKKWDTPEPGLEQALHDEHVEGEAYCHRCGVFRDRSVPVVVEGQTLGYVVFPRTLTEEPSVDAFRKLAEQKGMPPETGEMVARSARVMTEERLEAMAQFVEVLAGLVTSAAYDTLRAEQVLALEELRDSLVAMIVHDLRTPLTSMIGSLQTLVDSEYDGEMAEILVPMALSSSEQLLEMVNTLLDINKMESGELDLQLGEVNLCEIAETAIKLVQGLATEYEHAVMTEVADGLPPLTADGELLRRVMVNLLGNALKFTQAGGEIKLVVAPTDEGVLISVTDNGPGIPPEDQARIFEKFGQAQTRQEGRKHSTGLGLTFCKMVAEAHGGRIWVESEVGKGSTFSVLLPR